MDVDEAREQLATVAASRDAVRAETRRLPFWYVMGIAVALAVLTASSDLGLPGWASVVLYLVYVAALAVMCVVAVRRSRVRPHRTDYVHERLVAVYVGLAVAFVVAILVPMLIVNTVDPPLPGVWSGIGCAVLFVVWGLVLVPRADRWARTR